MEFLQIVAYHGPNRWSGVPTLEVLVDLGSRATWRSEPTSEAVARVLSWLPALDDPPQQATATLDQLAAAESFQTAVSRGMNLAELLCRVVGVLEAAAGTPPMFLQCEPLDSPHRFWMLFEFEEEELGRACLESARRCVLAAIDDQPFDSLAEIRKLVDLADDVRLGPSTRAILRAARNRGIPVRRLTSGSLVQLGEGARQHRIWTAETDQTSSIGEDIAQDKELTKTLLRSVGVPVPQGRVADSADDAWAAAQEIGFPVVIKPRDANHGRGISFELETRESINAAFELALRENKDGTAGVIVEQFARGQAHRLLVVGDRLIAAARGQVDAVIGDGRSTIGELVEQENRDPLRGENYTDPLSLIELDDVALLELKRQKLTPDSIPSNGQRVILRLNGDLTTDETQDVHPAVAERSVLAAQVIGLNIAGMDVIAEDIGRPLEEQGGMIIEVNAGPGLSMHVEPLYGKAQPVGEAIVELMFPGDDDGRIPVIGLSCGAASSGIASIIASLLRRLGRRVGMAIGDQVQVDGFLAYELKGKDRDRIHSLLLHPRIEAALFESHPAEAASLGLGCERCDVAVLTAIPDQPNNSVVQDWLSGVLPLVHAVPLEGAVIVPAEPTVLDRLVQACQGQVVVYSSNGETPAIRDHQARGGRVAFALLESLVLGAGPNAFFLPLRALQTSGAIAIEDALPAIAAAWCAGVPVELLRSVLGRSGVL